MAWNRIWKTNWELIQFSTSDLPKKDRIHMYFLIELTVNLTSVLTFNYPVGETPWTL
jgi:hypothetical protein